MQTTETKLKKSRKRELAEWSLSLLGAVVIALLIRTLVFSPYIVKGASMNDTLADREVMFATKFDYLTGAPQRFDVVICHYPGRSEDFVKRIVGVAGDTVAVSGGYLYINNVKQEEPYIAHRPSYEMPPYTVREGEFFVLGDNRDNSNDSHLVGPLRREQIVAHVRGVVWPLGRARGVE